MVPKLEEARLWVKVISSGGRRNFLLLAGGQSTSSYLHPHIIPSNTFVDDKVVVFLV